MIKAVAFVLRCVTNTYQTLAWESHVRGSGSTDAVDACAQHIRSSYQIGQTSTTMPVTREELEAAIRSKFQVTHVEVEDNSSGCGENFSVLIVSKVKDRNREPLGRH
jgi:hypothetical protein